MQKLSLQQVAQIAAQSRQSLWQDATNVGREPTIFLHWSAGHYGQPFADYHINIDQDGSLYVPHNDLSTVLAHTWKNNTGNIGVSMMCCAFATTNDLGDEPPTEAQIEAMAQVIDVLCKGLWLTIDYKHVRTHAEQADIDDYGPNTTCERWDGWFWHNGDEPGSGGDLIRGKANWYKYNT